MDNFCDTVTFRGSYEEPPEYCENEPIPDTDKCANHTDDWDEDRADQIRKGEL